MNRNTYSFVYGFLQFVFISIFSFYCISDEVKDVSNIEDTSYQIKFAPCSCKRQDMLIQAKKTILIQGIRDYEELTAKEVEPELQSKIIDENYDYFLYDFTLDEKSKSNLLDSDNTITAEAKVKQRKIGQFLDSASKYNRHKPQPSSSYGSKGLEVIKSFQSDRKKNQTIGEMSKSKSPNIQLYEIVRK